MNSIELDSDDIMNDTKIKSNNETLKDTLNQKSGIYKIINKVNGKYYVGSTKDFNKRWKKHINKLIKKQHHNDYLQRAWDKYGKQSFIFIIVETTESLRTTLREVEQKYLDTAKTEQDKCYNLNFKSTGGEISEYSLEKLRQKSLIYNKRRICSESTKAIKKIQNSGNSNPNTDPTIYHWKNILTGNIFVGTRYDFRKTHNVSKYSDRDIMNGSIKRTKSGWVLIQGR